MLFMEIIRRSDAQTGLYQYEKSIFKGPFKFSIQLSKKLADLNDNQDNFNLSQNEAKRIIDLNDIHYDKNDDDQTFTEFVASIYLFLAPRWKIIITFPMLFFLFALLYLNNFAIERLHNLNIVSYNIFTSSVLYII